MKIENMSRWESVVLFSTPQNNHGCSGATVKVTPVNSRYGVVVDGHSCSSCWQVGHDDGESPIRIGALVKLPDVPRHVEVWDGSGEGHWDRPSVESGRQSRGWVSEETFEYGDTIPATWRNAPLPAGYSHNELVDDRLDPEPDCTLVRPEDLTVVEGGTINIPTEGDEIVTMTVCELVEALEGTSLEDALLEIASTGDVFII